jgi:Group II intron, maturase-specific domain
MGYFGLAAQLKLFDRLDQWLRRRIRACYWKQWRRPKRRREMLVRMGVPRRQAIRHARSRKGPWHMARYLIAMGHCQWSWPDQRVARRTGVTEPQDSLGIACPSSLNRRMRTRMSGGVRRAPSTGDLTRLSCDSWLSPPNRQKCQVFCVHCIVH